jgi:hypothetical protein
MSKYQPAPFLCPQCDSDEHTMQWLEDKEMPEYIEAHYTCHVCNVDDPTFKAIIEIPYEEHHKVHKGMYVSLQTKWWRYK